ncbi:MAG: hypothetical protein ABW252_24490 [Polyangiales bacterium]
MRSSNGILADLLAASLCVGALAACEAPSDTLVDEPSGASDEESAAQWVDPEIEPPRCDALPASVECNAPLAAGVERLCRAGNRQYTIRAGKTYDPCKPSALVVDVPTAGESAGVHLGRESFCMSNLCWMGIGSGWAAESDTPGGAFIVVVPHGTPARGDEEAKALRDIVSAVKKVANIDAKRVYASGLGAGGDSAYEAACRESDVFRGAATNSAALGCTALKKPVPAIAFGARGDYNYSRNYAAIENVAKLNGCKSGPSDWRKFDGESRDPVCRSDRNDPRASIVPCNTVTSAKLQPTLCKAWTGCKDGTEVVWCDVAPSTDHGARNAAADAFIVYHNATNLNTPSVAWRFFQQFAPQSGAGI